VLVCFAMGVVLGWPVLAALCLRLPAKALVGAKHPQCATVFFVGVGEQRLFEDCQRLQRDGCWGGCTEVAQQSREHFPVLRIWQAFQCDATTLV
jgi:hypothetical protein